MSASQKLKALNERRSTDDMVTYHDALPEILAVIEAAEKAVQRTVPSPRLRIRDALAALEEKLS